jgi:ABC-2 type transport system permease protein
MRRLDYPLAKYAAFLGACLVMLELPLLLLYLGTIVSAGGASDVWHETRALIPGLLVGAMWAIVLAAIGLALASLTGRRAYATGAIAIYFFLTWTLATLLTGISSGGDAATAPPGARLPGLLSPFTVFEGVRQWLGGSPSAGSVPPPGNVGAAYAVMAVLLLVAALGTLAARYRRAGA